MSEITSNQKLSNTSSSPVVVNGFVVPSEVTLPAQLGVGASYQLNSGAYFKAHPGLVLTDLVFVDRSVNAVGVESVLVQKKQTVGESRTMSVRAGTELEVWRDRLRVRLGSYYEPSYYEGVSGRTHITGGFEGRLFQTHIWGDYTWGLTYTIDSARDYLNQYLSLGFWYSN